MIFFNFSCQIEVISIQKVTNRPLHFHKFFLNFFVKLNVSQQSEKDPKSALQIIHFET